MILELEIFLVLFCFFSLTAVMSYEDLGLFAFGSTGKVSVWFYLCIFLIVPVLPIYTTVHCTVKIYR